MKSQSKTSTDLQEYVQNWHSNRLRETARAAVDLTLALSKDIQLKWSFSSAERQWTATPNFVAFRFPTTIHSITCWIYTRNLVSEIDGLEFCASRPKSNPTYQSVRVTSPDQLPALEQYISRAFALKVGFQSW